MQHPNQATITQLLDAARAGNHDALNKLFPLVYRELHAQAQAQRRRWQGNYTVNTTALVHEAYLKIADQTQLPWLSRAHFFGVAAKAMRHILIDYAKRSRRQKRGGDAPKVPLDEVIGMVADPEILLGMEGRVDDFLALDEALQRLSKQSERQGRVVECRFFGGMTIADTAAALGISPATAKRDWVLAQAWLYRELK